MLEHNIKKTLRNESVLMAYISMILTHSGAGTAARTGGGSLSHIHCQEAERVEWQYSDGFLLSFRLKPQSKESTF